MFTWICPQCGREVPPSYNECPDCAGKQTTPTAPAPQPAQPAPAPPAAPGIDLPRSLATSLRPRPARGIPAWLVGLLSAAGFAVLGLGAYWAVKYFTGTGEAATPAPAVALEKPGAAQKSAKTSPLQKYIEVVGVRLTEEPNKKASVRFVVVNHSGAEIADLAANVALATRNARPGDQPAGTFSFKGLSLGPYESKELSATVTTRLRVYELPDWQFLEPQIQITSPQ